MCLSSMKMIVLMFLMVMVAEEFVMAMQVFIAMVGMDIIMYFVRYI